MPANRSRPVRVVLVDDNPSLRAGARALVLACGALDVVAECTRCAGALSAIARKRPHVVVLGIDGVGGLDFLAQLKKILHGDGQALAVTGAQDPAMHYRILRGGAMGIVPKDQLAEKLTAAILELHAGRAWVDVAIMQNALEQASGAHGTAEDGALTRREREIAALVSRGLRNPRIAEELFVSEGTIRNHLTVIFRKLGVNDRYALIARWHDKQ